MDATTGDGAAAGDGEPASVKARPRGHRWTGGLGGGLTGTNGGPSGAPNGDRDATVKLRACRQP
jgi:hypothetical protein